MSVRRPGKPRVSSSITCYLISLCQGLSLNLELGGQPGCPLFPLLWGYRYLWPHLVFIRVSHAYLLSHFPRFSCLVLGIISYFLFRKVFICCYSSDTYLYLSQWPSLQLACMALMSVSFLLEYSRRTVTPFPAVPAVLTHTCAALVCSAVPSTWVFVRWLFADCLCTLKLYQGTGDFTSSCPALAPSLREAFPPLLAALTKQGFAQAQKRKHSICFLHW